MINSIGMAPRRTHTKSRNGCGQCKRRHVKCDEQGPPCTNCITRELECCYSKSASSQTFPGAKPSLNLDRSVSPRSSSAYSTTAPPDTSASVEQSIRSGCGTTAVSCSPRERLKELELMRQWCTKTCYSFTYSFAPVFQEYVVEEALKHDFLMGSILALASLHKSTEINDPVAAGSYISTALQYQNNAVPNFRTALYNVTPSNCDAVFASSILTMAYTVFQSSLPSGSNAHGKSPIEDILPLFEMVKGIASIIEVSRQWLDRGPLGVMLESQLQASGGDDAMSPIRHLYKLNDIANGTMNFSLHKVYSSAIKGLEKCFTEDKRKAIPWLVMVGDEYINEFRREEPLALLIFLYWGVLLDQLDELWWAKCSGRRFVEKFSKCVLGHGQEWDEAMHWAQAQVGL